MMDSSPEEEAPVRITREAPKRGACVAPSRSDFQGIGKSTAMRQESDRWDEERPACACIPALIAVSFHRLFLGGLLPSRARFRFAGYCLESACRRVPVKLAADWTRQQISPWLLPGS
jgi:hypothetical protein